MAKFQFSTTQDRSTFIAACQAAFIEVAPTAATEGYVALTQSWGSPSSYPVAGERTIELPWTVYTHGEHRAVPYCTEEGVNPNYEARLVRKFNVTYKSSMGSGTARLVVDEGAMAPEIEMLTFEPSEKFLRLAARLEQSETRWWYTTKAMELLGWIRPATEAEENHPDAYNSGGTIYRALSIQDKALNALRERARPEPTEFMKMRGLVYKRAS